MRDTSDVLLYYRLTTVYSTLCLYVYVHVPVFASKGHCSVVYMTLWQGEIDHDSTIWLSSFYYDNGHLNCDLCHLDFKLGQASSLFPPPPFA